MTFWLILYATVGIVLSGSATLWLADGLSARGLALLWCLVLTLWLPIVVCLVLGYAARRAIFWWKGW